MFCSNCGNQIDDTAKFCENCGASVDAPDAPAAGTPPAPAAKNIKYSRR
ncbi:MAG: zinc ribbon domain-containing protein [Kiritimatiellae bacterium]|nr:zinc ribbon domain-containing protein [Kiritimatiellia bacterium]